jgi:hypothetical protein
MRIISSVCQLAQSVIEEVVVGVQGGEVLKVGEEERRIGEVCQTGEVSGEGVRARHFSAF